MVLITLIAQNQVLGRGAGVGRGRGQGFGAYGKRSRGYGKGLALNAADSSMIRYEPVVTAAPILFHAL